MARNKFSKIEPIVKAIPCNGDEIRIRPISDVHIGDPHCDEDMFRRLVKRIKDDPDCYTVLVGDICNTALKNSKSDVYGDRMPPGAQARLAAEILAPITDRILGIVPGNHEGRVVKEVGLELTEYMAMLLGRQAEYRAASGLIYLSVGSGQHSAHGRPIKYSVYINHGHGGGGRRPGGKLNAIDDIAKFVASDIIIAGHTHSSIVEWHTGIRCCTQNNTAEYYDQCLVNLPSMLWHRDSYGDAASYPPGTHKYPCIALSPKKREIEVRVGKDI